MASPRSRKPAQRRVATRADGEAGAAREASGADQISCGIPTQDGDGDPIAAPAASKPPRINVPPGLHLVATPIGNLADISARAIETLRRADVIACEDSRVTGKLCAAYGIRTRLVPYHDHNAKAALPGLMKRLHDGEIVALVSDAGTPLVSDPGYRLVRAAAEAGINVTAVPGPSAALAALAVAGLPTDRFLFAGFLPPKRAARRAALAELAGVKATLVVYESPRRLAEALSDMADVLGAREAAVARELTKLHEEARRGRLADLAAAYAAEDAPKGEVVVVIGPPEDGAGATDDEAVEAMLRAALAEDGATLRDAVDAVAAASGRKRREIYARALAMQGEPG
jgi:16S rRNA (cytidine1402-2'-O)-methyltransferase